MATYKTAGKARAAAKKDQWTLAQGGFAVIERPVPNSFSTEYDYLLPGTPVPQGWELVEKWRRCGSSYTRRID